MISILWELRFNIWLNLYIMADVSNFYTRLFLKFSDQRINKHFSVVTLPPVAQTHMSHTDPYQRLTLKTPT